MSPVMQGWFNVVLFESHTTSWK